VHLLGVAPDSRTKSPKELIRESTFENVDRCTEQVYLLGVAPDSRTKSPQKLIWESNFASTPNVESFFLLFREPVISFILSHSFPLSQIDENEFLYH
jgi:hypothetical protein